MPGEIQFHFVLLATLGLFFWGKREKVAESQFSPLAHFASLLGKLNTSQKTPEHIRKLEKNSFVIVCGMFGVICDYSWLFAIISGFGKRQFRAGLWLFGIIRGTNLWILSGWQINSTHLSIAILQFRATPLTWGNHKSIQNNANIIFEKKQGCRKHKQCFFMNTEGTRCTTVCPL